jgi:hypothetical protein
VKSIQERNLSRSELSEEMQAKYKSSERETLIVSSVEHRAVGVHEDDEMHLYLIPLLPCPVIGSRSSPHES